MVTPPSLRSCRPLLPLAPAAAGPAPAAGPWCRWPLVPLAW